MTIASAALAIGAFLVAATLIWKKLRFIEARVRKMQNELNELRTMESRLFLMALNASPKPQATAVELHNIPAVETNAGKRAPDVGPPFAEGHASGAELIPLVPPAQRWAAEQEGGSPCEPV